MVLVKGMHMRPAAQLRAWDRNRLPTCKPYGSRNQCVIVMHVKKASFRAIESMIDHMLESRMYRPWDL